MTRSVAKNIGKIYGLQMAQTALIGIPVIVLFVQENGVTLQQFFLLEAIFSGVMFVTEIPTGYLADRWGRKNTLLLAALCSIVGTTLFAMGRNFWHFAIAESFFAIFITLNSGAMEAMTYETLLEIHENEKSRSIFAKQIFFHMTTHSLASIAGGIIAAYFSLRWAMWATVPFMLIGLIITQTLVEPRREILEDRRHWKALHEAFSFALVRNVPLRYMIIMYSIIASLTMALVWLSQLYQAVVALPLALFGVAHAVMIFGGALASVCMLNATRYVNDKMLFMSITTILITSYLFLGVTTTMWGLIFLFLGRSMWGALLPLSDDLVNRMTNSDIRATVLSVRTFAMRLLYTCILPFLGYIVDAFSLSMAFLLTGIIGAVAILLLVLFMKNIWAMLPSSKSSYTS